MGAISQASNNSYQRTWIVVLRKKNDLEPNKTKFLLCKTQWTNQSINQTVNQSINQLTNQTLHQSIHLSINPWVGHSNQISLTRSLTHESINQLIGQSINWSISQSVDQSSEAISSIYQPLKRHSNSISYQIQIQSVTNFLRFIIQFSDFAVCQNKFKFALVALVMATKLK